MSHDLNQITRVVIGCAYRVSNTLGAGFLEKVYENALVHELRKEGLQIQQSHPIPVYYEGVVVGKYFADVLVEETTIVEIKVAKALDDAHSAQCINYLTATGKTLCLLINFGQPRVEIKRLIGRTRPGDNPNSVGKGEDHQ